MHRGGLRHRSRGGRGGRGFHRGGLRLHRGGGGRLGFFLGRHLGRHLGDQGVGCTAVLQGLVNALLGVTHAPTRHQLRQRRGFRVIQVAFLLQGIDQAHEHLATGGRREPGERQLAHEPALVGAEVWGLRWRRGRLGWCAEVQLRLGARVLHLQVELWARGLGARVELGGGVPVESQATPTAGAAGTRSGSNLDARARARRHARRRRVSVQDVRLSRRELLPRIGLVGNCPVQLGLDTLWEFEGPLWVRRAAGRGKLRRALGAWYVCGLGQQIATPVLGAVRGGAVGVEQVVLAGRRGRKRAGCALKLPPDHGPVPLAVRHQVELGASKLLSCGCGVEQVGRGLLVNGGCCGATTANTAQATEYTLNQATGHCRVQTARRGFFGADAAVVAHFHFVLEQLTGGAGARLNPCGFGHARRQATGEPASALDTAQGHGFRHRLGQGVRDATGQGSRACVGVSAVDRFLVQRAHALDVVHGCSAHDIAGQAPACCESCALLCHGGPSTESATTENLRHHGARPREGRWNGRLRDDG